MTKSTSDMIIEELSDVDGLIFDTYLDELNTSNFNKSERFDFVDDQVLDTFKMCRWYN